MNCEADGSTGYSCEAIIGDLVWFDENADSNLDGGEPGIPLVTIDLIEDTNNNAEKDPGEPVLSTEITGPTGLYYFRELPPGWYIVELTDVDGELDGLENTFGMFPWPIFLNVGDIFDSADFGYTAGEICGKVYHDVDGDGRREPGELGIPGISVDLILDDNGNGNINPQDPTIATVYTNADGDYCFILLGSNSYLVLCSDTMDIVDGWDLTDGGDPTDVPLDAGERVSGVDFGYTIGSIEGRICSDEDGDGDSEGNPGISDITIDLLRDSNSNGNLDNTDELLFSTMTNAAGMYNFQDLPAEDYFIHVTDQLNKVEGYEMTLGENPVEIDLGPGDKITGVDFCYQKVLSMVWYGVTRMQTVPKTVTNPRLASVTISLVATPNPNCIINMNAVLIEVTETLPDGSYEFPCVQSGNYAVDVTDENHVLVGSSLTGGVDPACVNLSPGEDRCCVDFGYAKGCISGIICFDADGDGAEDFNEYGIEDVSLNLISDDDANRVRDPFESVLQMTVSNADGHYSFCGVRAGNYIVTVTDSDKIVEGWELTVGRDPVSVEMDPGEDVEHVDFCYTVDLDAYVLLTEMEGILLEFLFRHMEIHAVY
eukprot:TRINITY_DN72_c0_g1_i1.p1 TRINITY_DN72_c0_g1~~TRINITY_DN72_c0_g1_i1.p1  ORF type:complete len:661 (+),score=149.02 TRINITY_DN72_c0_g1_i1:192-1985(+)